MSGADDHLILFKQDGETATRSYNYDSAAGIVYTVDVSQPAGDRVTIISMADGAPFDENKSYSVAVNSYRGNGGGGHLTVGAKIPKAELEARILSSTTKDLRYLMMKWIERQRTVTPEALGNWTVIPAEWWRQGKAKDVRLLYH